MAKQRTPPAGGNSPKGDDARAVHDAMAFRAAVHDVKPLTQTPQPEGLAKPKPRVRPGRRPVSESLDEMMPLLPSIVPVAVDDALSFQRAGVRTQILRRLRRGLIPIEGELDLHGLSQTAARYQLAQFLSDSRSVGWRCVRIVHGKGYRSGARGPVLKTAVDLWLRRHADVMAFTSARAIDGGTGAVYVLLRS